MKTVSNPMVPQGAWDRARAKLVTEAQREGFDAFPDGPFNRYRPMTAEALEFEKGYWDAHTLYEAERERQRP